METYIARNTLNGKFYIGSTKNFEERKKGHLKSKENYPFQNALRKNPDSFEWEVWSDNSEEPILEQALLDMWYGKEYCYNLSPYANRPPDMSGKKMWVDESGNQTFSNNTPGEGWRLGVSEERKKQNSLAKKGKKESPETREKKSKAHKGKKRSFTPEHCANISKACRGLSRGREGGLVAGRQNVELGKGFCNPSYKESPKYLEDKIKASEKAASVTSKPIRIFYPDGTQTVFPSVSEASRVTGMTGQTLGSLAKSGKEGSKGVYKGIRVEYFNG
jgi:group I intron endonuclease